MSGGGYTFQKIGAVISPTTSTTFNAPFYRFKGPSNRHFFSTNKNEGTNLGYTYEKIQCYVSTTQKSGTIPLYRYFA
jgi:hypothetical protein